jgi:hypothetical protein
LNSDALNSAPLNAISGASVGIVTEPIPIGRGAVGSAQPVIRISGSLSHLQVSGTIPRTKMRQG